ncbi:MAG: hypothetical protein HYY84_18295 [Deltaproteobacteria bacterium]|nr:hypothetical protein [Deltaproteobacteria bacterium]
MTKKNAPSPLEAPLIAVLGGDALPPGAPPHLAAAHAFLCGRSAPSTLTSLDAETIAAVVAILVERANVDRLCALESDPSAPHVTRAARRGLHVLRTRGVAVQPAASRTSAWRVAAEPLPDARLGLDFMYDLQWLTVYRRNDTGDGVGLIATIDGEGALQSLEAIQTTRGRYRELALSVAPRDAFTTEIGADDAYRRLLTASATRDRLGRPHLEYASILSKLTPLPETTPEAALLLPADAPAFDREAFTVFAERPELRTWVPNETSVRAFVEAVKDAQTSLVAIDNRQIAGQIQTVVARTAGQYFTADRSKTHARRFADLAGEFGRRAEAKAREVALALSSALAADGFDAASHPYALWFFGRFVPAITAEHPARIARGVEPQGRDPRQSGIDPSAHPTTGPSKIIMP